MITVELDRNKGILRYYINKEDQGVAFKNLKNEELYFAFSLRHHGSRVEMEKPIFEKLDILKN